ncbi:hypothetical protein CEP53_004052 [Fusarium sp. AF-6]|nr:hypothetical protein CEP53_004052 [Fusarium sp. AF-6]
MTLTNMARLEDDDEAELQGHTLWEDLIPIVRLLVAPYNPIMEFARRSGPNGTANGVFISVFITFWFGLSILFFFKVALDEGTEELEFLVCGWFLCYLVAAFYYSAIVIANEVRRERPNGYWTPEPFNRLLHGMWFCFTLLNTNIAKTRDEGSPAVDDMIHIEEKDKTEEANSSVTEPAPESREISTA